MKPEERARTGDARSAVLYLLMNCNARCPFCSTRVYTPEGIVSAADHRNERRRPLDDYTMSLDDVRALYRRYRDTGVESVNIQGGEPTLYPHLAEVLRYGREVGLREQVLVTNGRRFKDAAFTRHVVEAKPDTISLSIFGASAATHDASLGGPGAFDDLVTGARHLVAELARTPSPTHLTGSLVLHARNFRELPTMLRFWHGLGLRHFTVRLLVQNENLATAGGDWFFDLAELRPHLDAAIRLSMRLDACTLSMAELFFCLVDPSLLGFVVQGLPNSERLRVEKVVDSRLARARHGRSAGPDGREAGRWRRLLNVLGRSTPEAPSGCRACHLESFCLKPFAPYAERYSGHVTPIVPENVVRDLLDRPLDGNDLAPAVMLARAPERLVALGVPEALALRFQAKIVGELDEQLRRARPPGRER